MRSRRRIESIAAFGAATRCAIAAGFDGVELHGTPGFPIHSFLSPPANRRADGRGGSLWDRMRFPLAVMAEVRRVIAAEARHPFALGYRISPEEADEDSLRIGKTLVVLDWPVTSGIDHLHVSLGDLHQNRPIGVMDGATALERILAHVDGRVPMMAAGRTPAQAVVARSLGLAMVAVGRGR